MADVIAIILCVADGKPTKLACCNRYLADVVAKVTDGIANQGGYNKHLADVKAISGRWNSH